MKNQEEKDIYDDLKDLGCCDRCILRFLNVTGEIIDYNKPKTFFENLGIQEEIVGNENDEIGAKKLKENPCRICLNILQESKLDDFVSAAASSEVKEYNYDDFAVLVSFPKSVYLRSHAVSVHLREKYKKFYEEKNIVAFNKIFRYAIKEKLALGLNKTYNIKSNLEITISIGYEGDEKEVVNVVKLDNSKFSQKKRHLKPSDLVSRNSIGDVLLTVDDNLFKKHFTIPPSIPTKEVHLISVTCIASPIYFGGRYLKYSRDMGQTPWVINNKKVTEHCVQDFIFDAVRKVLSFENKFTFSSSGREDSDVRMLGTGRPFYIQIDNPKTRNVTKEQFQCIEKEIRQSKVVVVNKLKVVSRSDLAQIKHGEESKRKTYVALCMAKTTDVKSAVEKINKCGPVELAQKTPIRVLHRRTQSVRVRNVYRMEAKEVPGYSNLFELELDTQAGTYVKEFVHGDLERTLPNLGKIIGCPVDIVALDVTKIDLEWPDFEIKPEVAKST